MIYKHQNGDFSENTWIFVNDNTGEAIIVDPGDDMLQVFELLDGKNVTDIFITHGHIDHILGLAETKNKYPNARIIAHELANETLPDPHKNLSYLWGYPITAPKPDYTFSEQGTQIEAAGQKWNLFHTPGHAYDHAVFLGEDGTLFGGDVLFQNGGIGRVDLEGASPSDMRKSLKFVLNFDPKTVVHPGHGDIFLIEDAKPFFNF